MDGQVIRVVLLTEDRHRAVDIRSRLEEEEGFEVVATLESLPGAERMPVLCAHWTPDVLFVNVADSRQGIEMLESIQNGMPGIPCVVCVAEVSGDQVVALLRAGATDCMLGEPGAWSIENLLPRLTRLRSMQPSTRMRGRVLGFTSLKSGSGASTLATQSAFTLRRLTSGRVLLIDLNLSSGVSESFAELNQGNLSVLDAFENLSKLGSTAGWDALTVSHNGIQILPAPQMPVETVVPLDGILRLIGLARQHFDWVALDMPAAYEALTLRLAPVIEDLIAVSTPEILSLHMAKRQLKWFDLAGVPKQALHLALNRTRHEDVMSLTDVERTLGRSIQWTFPNDYLSLHNAGNSALAGENPLAVAIRRFATGIAKPAKRGIPQFSAATALSPVLAS